MSLMRRGFITSAFAATFMAWLQPATAHHSFAPALTEDGEEVIEIFEGSIEIYKLLNPHTALIVNAINESGAVEDWLVELSSLASLIREGWTDDSLSAGDRVTIAILRSRTDYRGRLRAVLVHGATGNDAARLLVAYGIRGDTPVMRRLRERRNCGTRVVTVEVQPECVKRLVADGWLGADEADDAAKVRDAVADLLDCFGRHTLQS